MNRFWLSFTISLAVSAAVGIVLLELGLGFIAIGLLSLLLVMLSPTMSVGQITVLGFVLYFVLTFAAIQVMHKMPRRHRAF